MSTKPVQTFLGPIQDSKITNLIFSFSPNPSLPLVNKHFRDVVYNNLYPQLLTDWKAFIQRNATGLSLLTPRVVELTKKPLPKASLSKSPLSEEVTASAHPDLMQQESSLARIKTIYTAVMRCAKERGLSATVKQLHEKGELGQLELIPVLQLIMAKEDRDLIAFFKALSKKNPKVAEKLKQIAADKGLRDEKMMAKVIRKWMKDNQKLFEGIKNLELSNSSLNSLPREICYFKDLVVLNLLDNQISSLPPEIGQLSKLQVVTLSHNRLPFLPPEFAELNKLSEVSLADNKFSSFPKELLSLPKLNELNLAFNAINSLPSITTGTLATLREFDISFNRLTSIPDDWYKLPLLDQIDLRGHKFKSPPAFPSSIAVKL